MADQFSILARTIPRQIRNHQQHQHQQLQQQPLSPLPPPAAPAPAPAPWPRHSSTSTPRSAAAHSTNLTSQEVDEKPWKYIGYRGYSAFIASEDDFFVLRRFASISVRIALRLQDQVTILEEELRELDRAYSQRDGRDYHNGTLRGDEEERGKVLDELREKLGDFNEFILQQAALKKFPQPSGTDLTSIQNWHWNRSDKTLDAAESAYLSHPDDLFSLVPKEKSPLRRLLERWELFHIPSLKSFWEAETELELPFYDRDLGVITYMSDRRIDGFITCVVIGLGMAMLIAPMWILDFLRTSVEKLATITVFMVAFLVMVSYVSSAKPFEVLGATAAYSAVLMVFLQLGGGSSTPASTGG